MIKRFSVKNFKNFKDEVIIDFSNTRDYSFNTDLLKNGLINKAMILGKNNSGKSNLGAAIMDITTHLTDNRADNLIYKVYLCGDSLENYAEFKYEFLFNDNTVKYMYRKDSARRLIYEELYINDSLVFVYNYVTNEYDNNIEEAKTVDISKYNNIGVAVLKFIYNNTLYWSDDNPFKMFMEFVDKMLWFRSLKNNEFMGVMSNGEDLNDYIINNKLLKDFELFLYGLGQEYKLCEMNGFLGKKIIGVKYKRFIAPFTDVASTGTITLWLSYYWLNRAKNNVSFMYIDEFDAFYNYLVSEKFLGLLKANDYQTIVTSHNTDLVNNEILRPDCYLFLNNGKIISFADSYPKIIRKENNLAKIMKDHDLII